MWPFRQREHTRATFNIGELPLSNTRSGVAVNAETAPALSAVFGCLRLLCDVISTLPLDVYRTGSRQPVEKPSVLVDPASGMDFGEWVWALMWEALTSPAAWCLVVDRTGPGLRPSQLEPLGRGRVTVQVETDHRRGGSRTVHRLDGREIDAEQLWRLRLYPRFGAAVGLDPIAAAAETIGQAMAAQRFGADFFGGDAVPLGVLEDDGTNRAALGNQDQTEAAKMRWSIRRGDRRTTAVLPTGLKWRQITVAPEESQMLETQKFGVQGVCRYYGVPPELIGSEAGGSLTYANVEQRDLDLLKFGVGPKLARLESRLNGLTARGSYVKFNTAALLRTDLAGRYASYALALNGPRPWLTVDEVRELEDREPLPAAAAPPSLEVVA
jgi:HK97 family phage portal protein